MELWNRSTTGIARVRPELDFGKGRDRCGLSVERTGVSPQLVAEISAVEDLDLLKRVQQLREDGKVQAALREAEAGDVTSWEELRKALDL